MERRTTYAPLVVVVGLLAALLGLYVAGYFWLPVGIGFDSRSMARVYRWQWMVAIYQPAGKIESAVTGRKVVIELVP